MSKWGEKYAAKADEFSSTPWWEAEVRDNVLPHIHNGDTVMDVGCNTGKLLSMVEPNHSLTLIGVDPNVTALETLRQRIPRVNAFRSLKTCWQVLRDKVDFAAVVHSYAQMETPFLALRNLWSCMRPGGRVVVITHNPLWYTVFKAIPALFNGYTSDHTIQQEPSRLQLIARMEEAGFDMESCKYYGKNLIPFLRYRIVWTGHKPKS